MMRIIQTDEFRNIPSALNLQKERQLLNTTSEFIDHLDRLLTAGRLTTGSRQILTEYIDTNRGEIEDDRLIRDVIGSCSDIHRIRYPTLGELNYG